MGSRTLSGACGLLLAAGLFATAPACARTTLKGSVADTLGGRNAVVEMDFWDGIANERAVTNHDALHALLLSFGGAKASTYEARVAAARKRGWIGAGKENAPPANETARVGWIARAVCLHCGIHGGLTMRIVGARERYAVRELNHRRWLADMSPNQAISGLQLIALLGSAEDYRAGRGED